MKKLLILLLALVSVFSMIACGGKEDVETPKVEKPAVYTVSFIQEGQEIIKKYVQEGKALTDIPTPVAVKGYDVVWEQASYDKVIADMKINAVLTPKSYDITYNVNGGSIAETTQKVTYDAKYTLLTPTREGYVFVCWNFGDNSFEKDGKWKNAENVTLTAVWQKIEIKKFSIIFIQYGEPNVIKTLNIGETLALSEIPTPKQNMPGYEISWVKTNEEIMAITDNCIVETKKIGALCNITFDLGECADKGAVIGSTTEQIRMGEIPNFPVPTCNLYAFISWKTSNGVFIDLTKEWSLSGDITLIALWRDGDYTDNY